MSTSKSTRRTILTDDGELRQVNDDPQDQPEASLSAVYCTHCGTANPADSNFCRKCGNSLVDQDAEMLGVPSRQSSGIRKAKNDSALSEQEILRHLGHTMSSAPATVVEIFTMIFVAGMALAAIGNYTSWVAAIVLLAWFLIEAVRRTGHRVISAGSALVDIFTMVIVSAMVIAAVGDGSVSGWLAVIALLGWFLIEAVRAYIPPRH